MFASLTEKRHSAICEIIPIFQAVQRPQLVRNRAHTLRPAIGSRQSTRRQPRADDSNATLGHLRQGAPAVKGVSYSVQCAAVFTSPTVFLRASFPDYFAHLYNHPKRRAPATMIHSPKPEKPPRRTATRRNLPAPFPYSPQQQEQRNTPNRNRESVQEVSKQDFLRFPDSA